jgi:hypothetical protein
MDSQSFREEHDRAPGIAVPQGQILVLGAAKSLGEPAKAVQRFTGYRHVGGGAKVALQCHTSDNGNAPGLQSTAKSIERTVLYRRGQGDRPYDQGTWPLLVGLHVVRQKVAADLDVIVDKGDNGSTRESCTLVARS